MWLNVSRRVYGALRRRGAPHELAEDIVQDVALRVLAKDVPFVDADDLARFAHTVAAHLLIDRRRIEDGRKTSPSAEVDGECVDYADAVVERILATHVWGRLGRGDQIALLTADEPATTSTDYGRRFRARQRLLAIVASLEAWLLWILHRLRRPAAKSGVAVMSASVLVVLVFEIGRAPVNVAPSVAPAQQAARSAIPAAAATPSTRENRQGGDSTATTAPYRERISVPTRRVVIGPGPEGVVIAGTEPTEHDDSVICIGGLKFIPDKCLGDATTPLKLP